MFSNGASGAIFGTTTGHDLRLYSTNIERLKIFAGGAVQVNVPTSGVPFTVLAGTAGLSISTSSNIASQFTGLSVTNSNAGGYAQFILTSNGFNKQFRVDSAGNYQIVNTGGTAVIYSMDDLGQVAINGASTSTGQLSVNSASTGSTLVGVNNSSTGYAGLLLSGGTGNAAYVFYNVGGAEKARTYASSGGSFAITTGAAVDRLTITSAGNITLNAPSSSGTLTINNIAGQASMFMADGTSQGVWTQNGASGTYLGSFSNHQMALRSNNTDRVVIGSTGSVSINAPASGYTLQVTGNAFTPVNALTFAATQTINAFLSNVFTVTLTANMTSLTISNPSDGQTINLFLTQDATGSRTISWGSSIKWPGGAAGVLSTAANAVDLAVLTYRSSTGFWYASLSKAFA